MEKSDKIAADSARLEPPQRLRSYIFTQIRLEERRRAKAHFLVSFAVLPFSFFGVMFSLQYMAQEFYHSGLYSYFSLILSDTDVIFAYWKEFMLSLVETVPLFGVTVSLITIVLLLVVIRVFIGNLRDGRVLSFNN